MKKRTRRKIDAELKALIALEALREQSTVVDPGFRVVFRQVSEGFGGGVVVETLQTGAMVVGDEGVEIGIAFGVVEKAAVVGGAVLRDAAEVLAEAAVEAFDHAPRLRGGRLLVCGWKGWVRRCLMA